MVRARVTAMARANSKASFRVRATFGVGLGLV
jgi:hypothetical protein